MLGQMRDLILGRGTKNTQTHIQHSETFTTVTRRVMVESVPTHRFRQKKTAVMVKSSKITKARDRMYISTG